MGLEKCARCGKLFGRIHSVICPKCQPAEDVDFGKIHNVIRRSSGLKAAEIAALAEVELDCVMRMLGEGRLRFEVTNEKPTCGRCGAPAISMAKRLCERCLVELDQECAAAMRDLQKDMPHGVQPRKGSGVDVLGERRAELEQQRMSPALKRANELHERTKPGKSSHTVAREARDKKKR